MKTSLVHFKQYPEKALKAGLKTFNLVVEEIEEHNPEWVNLVVRKNEQDMKAPKSPAPAKESFADDRSVVHIKWLRGKDATPAISAALRAFNVKVERFASYLPGYYFEFTKNEIETN